MPPAPPLRRVVAFDDRMPGRVIMFGGGADMPACATDPQVNHYGASPPFSAKRGSNCEGRGSPVLGRAQGWRFAPPPPAASALTPSAHRSFGRSSGRRDAPTVDHALPRSYRACGRVPCLIAREHGVEDDDQLAHAGDDGDLRLFGFGDEALVVGLEHGVVLGGCAHDWHIEEVAELAASALDVALAFAPAAVIVVGRGAE